MVKSMNNVEKYITDKVVQYSRILLLESFNFEIEYVGKSDETMSCYVNYPYKDVTLGYSDEAIMFYKNNKSKLDQTIIHELCHVITDELYNHAVDRFTSKKNIVNVNETCVDHIANVVYRLSAKKQK